MSCSFFGATPEGPDHTNFRLWAPSWKKVQVALADGTVHDLQSDPKNSGCHVASLPVGTGSSYRFRLTRDDETLEVPDPASRAQDGDVHGYSVVVDHASYCWKNVSWRGIPWHESVIYELHVGLLEGYRGVEARLAELAAIGFTVIELMPVSDFPGPRNWGYDGVMPFAPDAAYGTPDDLKHLIDAAHGLGLAVLLDVVYNHFGPDGNYLSAIAPEFFREDVATPWGPAIDFRRPEVRSFFTENAIHWVKDYRFDGLRFDAVHAITESDWLDEMAMRVREAAGEDRCIHLVLENDDNNAAHLRPERRCFDAQWNDDAHHVLHVLLTGETAGYYGDYAEQPAKRLARVLAEGFDYQGASSAYRNGASRGTRSKDLPPTAFVDCLQNHDQIGNRPLGERLTSLADPESLRAATTLLLLSPHIPLVFMGEEVGSCDPFLYFTSHEEELAQLIREGRSKEFARFSALLDEDGRSPIPDPNDPRTFHLSVPSSVADQDAARTLYRDLLTLRRDCVVPGLPGARTVTSRTLGERAVEVAWRLGDGSLLVIAANLGDAPVPWVHHFGPEHLVYSSSRGSVHGTLNASCTVVQRAVLPATLARLADAAGVQTEWVDNQERPRFVTEATVRSVLAALGHPNENEDQIRASLLAISSSARARRVMTGRVGDKLSIPVLAAHESTSVVADLILEDGRRKSGEIAVTPDSFGRHAISIQVDEPGYHELRILHGQDVHPITLAIAPWRAYAHERQPAWGTAVQLYSLRAESDRAALDIGLGDYGSLAAFVADAGRAGADAVAVSPTHAGFAADPMQFSPYSPSSRLFYNVGYIDPVAEFGHELASSAAIAAGLSPTFAALSNAELVDWARSVPAKLVWLRAIFETVQPRDLKMTNELRRHAVFEALHAHFAAQGAWDWREWPAEFRDPESEQVTTFAAQHESEVRFHAWLQGLAADGLKRAQAEARRSGMRIGLVADMAIGMSGAGSHAWSAQRQVVNRLEVGAPPDRFNPKGQRWGLATFSPTALIDAGFEPFIATLRAVLAHAGGVRVDHVLGLNRLWLVPPGAPAAEGAYVQYPFEDLVNLLVLESHRHQAWVIGEDLGTVPPGFRETMEERGIFGMSVLWFERTPDGGFRLPIEWAASSVAMTTTHDLATSAGWWQGKDIEWRHRLHGEFDVRPAIEAREREKAELAKLAPGVAPEADGTNVTMEVVANAPSPLAIIPVEDLLGMADQPNIPGTMGEHPNWQRRLPLRTDRIFRDARVARRVSRLNVLRRRS